MIRISWTTINNYMICPMKVEHDLNDEPASISWAMAGGTVGHDTLKAWAEGKAWREFFEARWQQYASRRAYQKNWNQEFTDPDNAMVQRMLVLDLLGQYTAARKSDLPDPQLVERNLDRDLGDGVLLTGRVDEIGKGKIIDWKFASSVKYLSSVQACIYSILNGGPSVFEFHAMVKAGMPYYQPIDVPETRSAKNLHRVIEGHIKPIAFSIQAGNFPSNPTAFLCQKRYCGYWDICKGRFE